MFLPLVGAPLPDHPASGRPWRAPSYRPFLQRPLPGPDSAGRLRLSGCFRLPAPQAEQSQRCGEVPDGSRLRGRGQNPAQVLQTQARRRFLFPQLSSPGAAYSPVYRVNDYATGGNRCTAPCGPRGSRPHPFPSPPGSLNRSENPAEDACRATL